jgi:hypothetical protein
MVGGRVQRVCVDSCRGRGQSRVITDTLYLSIVSMLFEECSHSLSKNPLITMASTGSWLRSMSVIDLDPANPCAKHASHPHTTDLCVLSKHLIWEHRLEAMEE